MVNFLQDQHFTIANKGGSDILCLTQYQKEIAIDSEITKMIKFTANVDWVLYFTIWESQNPFATMKILNFQSIHYFQICRILFQLRQPSVSLTTSGNKFIYNLPVISFSFETAF